MPFLRPLGCRAPASVSMNLQRATYGQQPDEPGEILTFGQPERRSRLLPGIRRSAITMAARIVIGSLALAAAVLDLHAAASHAPVTARTHHAPMTARTQRPPAIGVLIASAVGFPLRGTPGALLQVQYLQAGDGPAAIWATLAASGLQPSLLMEKAYQERTMRIQELPSPIFDSLRSNPRVWQALACFTLAFAPCQPPAPPVSVILFFVEMD